jgi:hypothetical protein
MDKLEKRVGPQGRKLFEHAQANEGRVSPLATDSVTFSVSNGVDVTPFRQAR